MTDAELEVLLDDIESGRAERKESPSDGDRMRQAICAFANDLPDHRKPGVLFVGVNDTGQPTGLKITDQLLQNLASMRGDGNILPFPSLDVQKRRLKGQDVAVVIVHPSSAPPVRFKGAVWIRSGPRRGNANPEDERRLNEKRRYRDLPRTYGQLPTQSLMRLTNYYSDGRIFPQQSHSKSSNRTNGRSRTNSLLRSSRIPVRQLPLRC